MQSPRRLHYSCVITAVVLICAAQAIPGNVSTEEDTEILNNATIVDYGTARGLATEVDTEIQNNDTIVDYETARELATEVYTEIQNNDTIVDYETARELATEVDTEIQNNDTIVDYETARELATEVDTEIQNNDTIVDYETARELATEVDTEIQNNDTIVDYETASELATEEDTEIQNNDTVVDYETARKLAEAAYERLLYGNGTGHRSAFDGIPYVGGNANALMDMALYLIRNIIRAKNLDRVPVPDFEEKFQSGIIKGTFKGHNGWAESLLSVARKADANIRLDGATILLSSSLGLDKLQLGMNYALKVALINVKGDLDAKVASNAIAFEGGVGYSSGKCRFTLSTLKVADLGDIKVKVTGLGVLNGLNSKIVTWATKKFQHDIRELIEKKGKDILSKELEKLKCPF